MSLVREESSRLGGAASPAEYAAGPEAFFSLLKPRVMSLVVLTALAGMLVAPGSVHPVVGFAALLAISIGAGAAGALPPMIGWAAVGGDVTVASLALFAIIFMWTPPHFWALSLYRSDDYARAGVPMMPVIAGARETKKQMLLYSLVLVPITLAPYLLGVVGAIYAGAACLLGAVLVLAAARVWLADGDRAAKQMFAYSILYLFLLFTLMLVDKTPMVVA